MNNTGAKPGNRSAAKGTNRYRFLGFHERIARINVDVFHKVGTVDVTPENDEQYAFELGFGAGNAAAAVERLRMQQQQQRASSADGGAGGDDVVAGSRGMSAAMKRLRSVQSTSSFFSVALKDWADTDLSSSFDAFYRQVAHISHSLPLLLHHKKRIVDALLDHVSMPESSSRKALLALLPVLARDLRSEVYPFFQRIVCVLVELVDPANPELVEQIFSAIAYLFKFLVKQLVDDVVPVYNKFYAYLIAHRKPYVRLFAAESFAFLLRKVRRRDLPAVLRAIAGPPSRVLVKSLSYWKRIVAARRQRLLRAKEGEEAEQQREEGSSSSSSSSSAAATTAAVPEADNNNNKGGDDGDDDDKNLEFDDDVDDNDAAVATTSMEQEEQAGSAVAAGRNNNNKKEQQMWLHRQHLDPRSLAQYQDGLGALLFLTVKGATAGRGGGGGGGAAGGAEEDEPQQQHAYVGGGGGGGMFHSCMPQVLNILLDTLDARNLENKTFSSSSSSSSAAAAGTTAAAAGAVAAGAVAAGAAAAGGGAGAFASTSSASSAAAAAATSAAASAFVRHDMSLAEEAAHRACVLQHMLRRMCNHTRRQHAAAVRTVT